MVLVYVEILGNKKKRMPQDGSNNQLRSFDVILALSKKSAGLECWLGPTAVCLVGFCFFLRAWELNIV